MRRGSRTWGPLLVALATSVFVLYAFLPILWPDSLAAAFARTFFRVLCHQIEGRSFVVDGQVMPVCHRCTGIYLGIPLGALGAFVLGLDPTRLRNWAACLAPMAVQVVVAWVWDASDLWYLRVGTGLFGGAGAGLLLARLFRHEEDPR